MIVCVQKLKSKGVDVGNPDGEAANMKKYSFQECQRFYQAT